MSPVIGCNIARVTPVQRKTLCVVHCPDIRSQLSLTSFSLVYLRLGHVFLIIVTYLTYDTVVPKVLADSMSNDYND